MLKVSIELEQLSTDPDHESVIRFDEIIFDGTDPVVESEWATIDPGFVFPYDDIISLVHHKSKSFYSDGEMAIVLKMKQLTEQEFAKIQQDHANRMRDMFIRQSAEQSGLVLPGVNAPLQGV